MELMRFVVPTAVAAPGMTVRELFRECVRADVPGIPFCDADGRFTGKASIRHVLKESCIPHFLVHNARLLGDQLESLKIPEVKARRMLELEVDTFILPDLPTITPASPIAKALAIMENHDTTYVFVIDADGRYHGTISIMKVADRILEEYA
jgi:CBS-domain-containing membrane protein